MGFYMYEDANKIRPMALLEPELLKENNIDFQNYKIVEKSADPIFSQDIMRSVIQRTFEGYKLDSNKINQLEIFQNLDISLLTEFRQYLNKKLDQESLFLLKNGDSFTIEAKRQDQQQDISLAEQKIAHALTIDLGNYPMVPWITKQYKKTITSTYFAAPRFRNDLVIVRRGECVSVFELTSA